jgi:hypothetical protein
MLWKRVVQRTGSLTIRAFGKARYAMRAARARRVLQARRMTEGAPLRLVRWSNIVAASKLPETLTADLVLGRRGAYVEPLLLAFDRYIGQLLRIGKAEKITVPSDAALLRNIVHSALAFYMRKERDQVYTLDLGRLAGLPQFHGHGEVIGARIDRAAGTIAFQTTFGREYSAGDPLYDLAKLHFISSSYLFQLAVAHSWVHFHFPDIISALHYNLGLRAPQSVLYKLLQPHTRFVLALSESVLRTERNTIDNRPGRMRCSARSVRPRCRTRPSSPETPAARRTSMPTAAAFTARRGSRRTSPTSRWRSGTTRSSASSWARWRPTWRRTCSPT